MDTEQKQELEHVEEQKETEDQIVKKITTFVKKCEEATRDSRTEAVQIYNSYTGKMDNVVSAPYDTKETIPKLRTEIAYIKPYIFSGEPEVEFEGVGDEDKTIAKVYEKIVNFRFKTIKNFYESIEAWVGQALGFPASEIKVSWDFQTKKNPDGTEYVIKDEPKVEVPNHLDVYYNPIISDISCQPMMAFRSIFPVEEVAENPIYDYMGEDGRRNAEKVAEKAGKIENSQYNSTAFSTVDIPNASQKATEGMVEVYEAITKDRIQTISNGLVLRDIENPYGFINAVKLIFEPNILPNRYDGYGVGSNTLGLDKMFYKMFNQAMMNVKLGNNPMYLYKKGSVADKSQFVSKPGGGVEVNAEGNINDNIQFIQFPDLSQGFTALLSKIDDETKRASGATDLIQGEASNNTLGQDQLVQSNVSQRFDIIVRRFKQALAEVGDMILKMELQNLQSPDASILRIFPQELRPQIYELLISTRDDVKYNVSIKGDTNVARNKNLESKRLVELFNLSQNFLTDQEKRAFLRRIAEKQGEQNIDEIIGETNPMAQQQEMMQGTQGMEPQGQMVGVQDQQGLNQQATQ